MNRNNLQILKIKTLKRYYLMAYKWHVKRTDPAGLWRRLNLNKHHYTVAFGLLVLAVLSVNWFIQPNVKAQTKTFGASDIQKGTIDFNQLQIGTGNSSFSLQKGNIGQWSGGDGLQIPPVTVLGDTDLIYGPNGTLYMVTNRSGCRFLKYDTEIQKWGEITTPPVGCGSGSATVSDGTAYLYYTPGNKSKTFFRYDIANDQWKQMADLPADAGGGASATYINSGTGAVYVMRGNSSASLFKYNVLTDSWTTAAPFPATGAVDWGVSTAWDKGNNIYALSNCYGEFKKYSLATNSWTSLPSSGATGCATASLMFVNGSVYNSGLRISSKDQSFMQKFDPLANSWSALADPPVGQYYDWHITAAYDGSDSIYSLYGAFDRPLLYKYSVAAQKWAGGTSLSVSNSSVFTHWKLMYDNGTAAYYIGGFNSGNMDHIYKLDLTTQQFTQIGVQFGGINGVSGVYKGNALYTVPWFGGTTFGKYDLSTSNWVQLADFPFASNYGSDLVDGGDGFVYATFAGRANFARFSEATGWQSLAGMPNAIGSGSGITRIGQKLYVLAGAQTGYFNVYNLATATWSPQPETPTGAVDHGGFIASDGARYVYAGLGTRTDPSNRSLFRFDTTNSTWQRMADLPQDTQLGASAFYDTVQDKLMVAQGAYNNHLWSWSPTSAAYVTTGTWYSKSYDLTQVESWQSLLVNSSGSGTVTAYTRTSTTGRLWTDWQQVSGTNINSPRNRFVQVKITLTGDGTATPTVTGMSLNYSQETVAPNLPSQLSAFSAKGGQILTSSQKYQYQHPYFSWAGADDGANGSGIDGYYVYFGTDSSADPVTDGSYQTGSDYTTTTAMTAGGVYYLRIKVKDKLGNISGSATYFSYLYFYISPPGTILRSTQQDMASGTNVAVNIDGNGMMSLLQQPIGAWATGTTEMMPNSTSGAAMAVVGDNLYVMRGSSTGDFWRYDTVAQTWQTMASEPGLVNTGSALTWDGGNYLYAMTGRSQNSFYRYNIVNNAWETLPTLPAFVQQGSEMRYIGNNKLAMLFAGSSEFYIYNIASTSFVIQASPPLTINSSNTGGGMWYDGKDTVYTYFGAYDSGQYNRKSMAKYSISEDNWTTLSQPSFDVHYAENNLVGDGKGHLYAFGNDYTFNQSNYNMAEQYDIATDTWKVLPNATAEDIRGTLASDGERYIYIIPNAGNSRHLQRYDTWDDRFTPITKGVATWQRLPWDEQSGYNWQAGQATTAVYDGTDYVYAIGANEGTWSRFLQYSPTTGQTTYLPPPPFVGIYGSLAYSNGTLYYTSGRNIPNLYRFDMNTKSWLRMADAPGPIYRPGANGLTALSDGTLLAVAGNGNKVYRFTPNAGTGAWATMANTPGTVVIGAATYDGNNSVYVLQGNGNTTVYKYSVSTNTWATMAALPTAASFGAAMVYNDGNIYTAIGNNSTTMYVYNVVANSWQAAPSAPDYFRYGAVMIPITNQYALAIAGQDSPDFWRYNFPGSGQAYQGLATHISQPMAIDGLFDYAGIQAQVSTPANTKVEIWTRTSPDGTVWDKWSITDQVKHYNGSMSTHVTSTPQKFIQIKINLYSFDNEYTPQVSNYALDYYYDTTPPTSPTVMTVYADATKTTPISSNIWDNNPNPVIDWPDPGEAGGATDGPLGSNIKGYWVYVGTDPTAIPQTSGVFVPASEYTPTLTTSGTYYVRLQAVDMTGNIDPNVFSPFIYKFDNVAPTNPTLMTVTPAGFTGKNNYTFQWPNGFDNDSGIAAYCYHTGALSGPYAIETCQSNLQLKDVGIAYQSGTNVFYLRTKDVAGNFSGAYTEVSYYYSTAPPTPVTNLRAIPPASAQNLFAFTWDFPTLFSGDPDQLTYCYSINTLPTPLNTTCTGNMFLSAFKAATQQNTNIVYMVAKDEAGNVNWNNYAASNFIANTVSPGIPLNLVVNDTSDSASGRYSLTLTWDRPTFLGNGITHYVIERSEDEHTYTQLGTGSNLAYVDLTVVPGKIYYYRVRASDNVDNWGGASAVVAKSAKGSYSSAPKIVSDPKPVSSFDQSTVNWVTDRAATSFVYYGTSPTLLAQSKGMLDLASEHSIVLTGLLPSTIYYFKVQSFDNDRSYDLATAYSQLYTFKTTAAARIFNVRTADVGLTDALVNWETSVPTSALIRYGSTTDYGFTQEDTSGLTANHLFKLSDLASGTRYHYRIEATTYYGSTVSSDDYTFATIARPIVTGIAFQPVNTANTIAVNVTWNTNVPTSSDITYTALGSKNSASSAELTLHHELLIKDLASNTDYQFFVQGRDQYGTMAVSDVQKWHSGVDTKAPAISALGVDVTTMEGVGKAKAQLIIYWHTDEPATTQIKYDSASAKKLGRSTNFDPQPTVDHVVVISGLDLAKVYRIQPVSRDISGNTTFGPQLATVTPDQQQNPLDVVLTTLQRIFRL